MMKGARSAPALLNFKTLFKVELFLPSPTSAAPSVAPTSKPAKLRLRTQYDIMKKSTEFESITPIMPERANAAAIISINFLPYLSDNLPRTIIDIIPQKTPRKKMNPIVSKPILNSSAKTGIRGPIALLEIPRIKVRLKRSLIIVFLFIFASGILFKSNS